MKTIIKFLKNKGISAYYCGETARDIALGRIPREYEIAIKATISDIREKLKGYVISVNEYDVSITLTYKEKQYLLYPLKKIKLVNTYYNYEFTSDLKEDASSRDFTIHGLYYDPLKDKWYDFYNGLEDIKSKTIRFIGDGFTRIMESKIRLLKPSIIKAILGNEWTISPETIEVIKKYSIKIYPVHPKQIYTEIVNLFTYSNKPSIAFKEMESCGLLKYFFPEFQECLNIAQPNKSKGLTLSQHIILALDTLDISVSLSTKLAVLLHDIGKPYTEIYTSSGVHFYNHENIGAHLAEKILHRWGFPKSIIEKVSLLITHHLFDTYAYKSEVALKKLITKVGVNNIQDLIDLRIADRLGNTKKDISMLHVNLLREKVNILLSIGNSGEFRLNITDKELFDLLPIDNQDPDTIPQIKKYLENLIVSGKVKNKKFELKTEILKILKIKCPLNKAHLFKMWENYSAGTAELFSNGSFKCSIYCNDNCKKWM